MTQPPPIFQLSGSCQTHVRLRDYSIGKRRCSGRRPRLTRDAQSVKATGLTKRKRTNSRQAPLAHALLTLVVAILLISQNASSRGPSAHSFPNDGVFVTSSGFICAEDAATQDGSPPPQRRGHSHCCILCEARDWSDAPVAIAAQISNEAPRQSVRRTPDTGRPGGVDARPRGWASTRAPRAPPSFS